MNGLLMFVILISQQGRFESIHQYSLQEYWEGVRFENDSLIFRYSLPAKSVAIIGDFNGWNMADGAMSKDSNGFFVRAFKVKPGIYRYRLVVDGRECPDPTTRLKIKCPFRWFSAVKIDRDGKVSHKFSSWEKLLLCLRP